MSETNETLSAFDRGYAIGRAMESLSLATPSALHSKNCPGRVFEFVGKPKIDVGKDLSGKDFFGVMGLARCQQCGHEERFSTCFGKCPENMRSEDALYAAQLQKLQVQPGDVLVLELPESYEPCSEQEAYRIRDMIQQKLGMEIYLCIPPPGCKLRALRVEKPAQMEFVNEAGLSAFDEKKLIAPLEAWNEQFGISSGAWGMAIPNIVEQRVGPQPNVLGSNVSPIDQLREARVRSGAELDRIFDAFYRSYRQEIDKQMMAGDSEVAALPEAAQPLSMFNSPLNLQMTIRDAAKISEKTMVEIKQMLDDAMIDPSCVCSGVCTCNANENITPSEPPAEEPKLPRGGWF